MNLIPSSVSADDFVKEYVKIAPSNARIWLASFEGDPATAARRGGWTGAPRDPAIALPRFNGENVYGSIAVFPPTATSRQATKPHHILAVVLDDVGTKAKIDDVINVLGEPTARNETSAGNWQFWYFLDTPITKSDIDPIHDALKGLGALSDKSGLNSVRYVRWPTGVNGKPGKNNHAVRLTAWNPELRFSLAFFRDRLGLNHKTDVKGRKPRYTPPATVYEGAKPTANMQPGDAAGRDDELFRYGRSLAGALPPDKLLEAMRNFNAARCVPPLCDDDVLAKWKAACSYPSEHNVIADVEYAGADPHIVEQLRNLADDEFVLPNDYVPITIAAKRIFQRLGKNRELFNRADTVVEIDPEARKLREVSPDAFRSRLDGGKRRVKAAAPIRDQLVLKYKRCSVDTANALLKSLEVSEHLPKIALVSSSSVLVESAGKLVQLGPGYHEEAGGVMVFAMQEPQAVSLEAAISALLSIFDDFSFTAATDKSRAVANLIGPCLRMGRVLPGHALVNVIEANVSQTGKSYCLALQRAVYGELGGNVLKRKGGVGSLDESFAQQLMSGTPFITFENLRDRVESEYLEGVLTMHGLAPVRVPHKGEVNVNTRSLTVHMTSNGFHTTEDLGNRSLITRLQRQPEGYEFKVFPEGGLLEHINAQQPFFLGCVFAVVRHWYAAGKPRLPTTHSFREWVGTLDWIVQHIFDLPPLLDGHKETIQRVTNPALTWLREIAQAVSKEHRLGDELSASALIEISQNAEIKIPGGTEKSDSDDAARRLGSILGPCFKHGDCIQLDMYQVQRITRTEYNKVRKENLPIKRYVFTSLGHRDEVQTEEIDA